LLGNRSEGGTCAPNETCAVARFENGATSCVPTGNAVAGQSCVSDHCAQGLMCLGGLCYTLCHTAAPVECSASQSCVGGLPLFADPGIGVCQRIADATL
jgi:hypothetical protein